MFLGPLLSNYKTPFCLVNHLTWFWIYYYQIVPCQTNFYIKDHMGSSNLYSAKEDLDCFNPNWMQLELIVDFCIWWRWLTCKKQKEDKFIFMALVIIILGWTESNLQLSAYVSELRFKLNGWFQSLQHLMISNFPVL